jgi:hypothetical protein
VVWQLDPAKISEILVLERIVVVMKGLGCGQELMSCRARSKGD